jgi:hypothetical protein
MVHFIGLAMRAMMPNLWVAKSTQPDLALPNHAAGAVRGEGRIGTDYTGVGEVF